MNIEFSEEEEKLAEEIFLYAAAHRFDNLTKDGQPKDPSNVTTGWKDMHPCSQHHYRVIARWHLKKFNDFFKVI
jgi:hypothetical protein